MIKLWFQGIDEVDKCGLKTGPNGGHPSRYTNDLYFYSQLM